MTEINYASLIGRDDVNDLEAILAVSNTDVDAPSHLVNSKFETEFTWNYERSRPALSKLYEKAKTSQWNATTDLDWSIDVDIEKVVLNNMEASGRMFFNEVDLAHTQFAKWSEKEWTQLAIEGNNWTMSQFLHGEQGALLCTARIVETVPWIDAKYYASTQVMDEARHVEVFSRYLNEKLNGHYPLNAHLGMLRTEGAMVMVGVPPAPAPLAAMSVIFGNKKLAGSMIGGIPETQEMLDFCGERKITADVEVIPIEKINEAYERMLKSDVRYRFVIDLASLGRA